MQILIAVAEEKVQILGTDMINILSIDMHQKVDNLSNITTLTIDIQKALHTWEEFQHQLSVSVEAIVEVCVQQQPSTSQDNPEWKNNTRSYLFK